MYHVGPIGLSALVIYLITLYFASTGFITRDSHRRFWNWILLATFLTTGILGLFMALQSTYKWNIPIVDQILKWHVEFGIAMAFSAIIHFTWHFRYYFSTSKRSESIDKREATNRESPVNKNLLRILLLLVGFASSAAQFILLREAVILGGGSEASTGIFLWIWLTIAAFGAFAGGRHAGAGLRKMIWSFISGLAISLLLFIFMNLILLRPGEIASFWKILVIIAVSATPLTFISSFVFVKLTALMHSESGNAPGDSFGMETVGSVAAGILTTLSVSLLITNFQVYLLVLFASAVTALILFVPSGRGRNSALAALLMLIATVFIFRPDTVIRDMLLKGVRVESTADTPYGNITTGSYGGERTVFYDHRPLFFAGDIINSEENIHYALLQRERTDTILIISGGIKRHMDMIARHSVKYVVYLEHDPGILAAENTEGLSGDSLTVEIVRDDPVRYLRKSRQQYDAVIQLIPPPSTLSVSRFYTLEYFRNVSEHLNKEGIFLCTPMPFYNYPPASYLKSLSPVINSLKSVFSNVIAIPGSQLYVIASEGPLSAGIAALASVRGIEGDYVSSDYLDDAEIIRRGDQILSQTDKDMPMNTEIRPVSTWFSNALYMEMRGTSWKTLLLIAIFMIIPFLFLRRGGFIMFASSACLSGYGMIIIFLIQITTGNMYILTALIISLLMLGLAAGASVKLDMLKKPVIILPLVAACLFIVTGLTAKYLTTLSSALILALVFCALILAGFINGALYRVLTLPSQNDLTGRIYASDLAGSALGYLTVATVVVPLAGIVNASFVLSMFILVSMALASIVIKH